MFEDELKQIQEISIRQEAVPVSDSGESNSTSGNKDSATKSELIEFIDINQINNIDYSQIEETVTKAKISKLSKGTTSFLKFIKYSENNKTTGYYILVNKAKLTNERFAKLVEMYPNGCLIDINSRDSFGCTHSVIQHTYNYFIISPFVFNKNNSGIFKLAGSKLPGYIKHGDVWNVKNLYINNDVKLICVWFDGVVLNNDATAKLTTELGNFLDACLANLEKEKSTAKKRKLSNSIIPIHAKERVSERMGKILSRKILQYLSTDGKSTPAQVHTKPSMKFNKYGYTQYDISTLKGYALLNGMNVSPSTISFDMLINVLHTVIEEYKLMQL